MRRVSPVPPRAARRLVGSVAAALAIAATFAATASSDAVADARRDLEAASDALALVRLGVDADLTVRPRLDLVARDDPPRPRTSEFGAGASASLVWSPLRSEILLHEARVLEAELRLRDALRDDAAGPSRAAVERARATEAVRAAERSLADAADELAAAGEDGAGRARLAYRDAELDLEEARRALRALEGDPVADLLAGRPGGEERPDLALPPAPAPRELLAYRARALRLQADVARAERRRIDAFLPEAGVDAGYAGSDAAVSAGIALRAGRPRGTLQATWVGTRQERAWARLSFTLRLGNDAAAAAAAPDALREEGDRRLRTLADDLAREIEEGRAEAEARRARWRLAEQRLALERATGDEARTRRALDVARRDWLRFLRAHLAALEAMEAPFATP